MLAASAAIYAMHIPSKLIITEPSSFSVQTMSTLPEGWRIMLNSFQDRPECRESTTNDIGS